ncbi:hypothetical protein C7S16_0732 [Burkholderia thailandensis]|uniref:Uncharacterized protein n=1 Tax=Burkholderia thailandensis TaxID=57975 RepID=A0AAW9D2M7_BURTH|nr:hypothetical protein [Burkholderia thailandensis]MDW9254454.1 hypothetical protein [Burkholderia thailandensis]
MRRLGGRGAVHLDLEACAAGGAVPVFPTGRGRCRAAVGLRPL